MPHLHYSHAHLVHQEIWYACVLESHTIIIVAYSFHNHNHFTSSCIAAVDDPKKKASHKLNSWEAFFFTAYKPRTQGNGLHHAAHHGAGFAHFCDWSISCSQAVLEKFKVTMQPYIFGFERKVCGFLREVFEMCEVLIT